MTSALLQMMAPGLLVLTVSTAHAQNNPAGTDQAREAEVMEVVGQRPFSADAHLKKSDIRKTETYDGDDLRRFGARTLADALKQTKGIDTQVFCANCGAKRISINGLKGEHTSILVDGMPLHSTVSSFYGVDAVPVIGIEKLEVKRGAGSALIAPEAIGGAIDIITTVPEADGITGYTELGSRGSRQSSVLATLVKDTWQGVVAVQTSYATNWDVDGNNIAESPERETRSAMVKVDKQFGTSTELTLRASRAELEIIGGNTVGFKIRNYSPAQATPADFIDGDVRKAYTGDPARISEFVDLTRDEAAAQLTRILSPDSELAISLSMARQRQKAFYSHSFDYDNRDNTRFGDVRYRIGTADLRRTLTVGAEARSETMDTASQALFVDRSPPLPSDALDVQNQAIYVLGQFFLDDLELDMALRFDQVQVEWRELEQKIEETVVAPRLAAKYHHSHHLSTRLAYGLGYRTPLTLFESQHGSNHDGFLVEIDRIERAHSLVLSLSANFPAWFVTASGHWTRLENMAYGLDRTEQKLPIIYENSDTDYDIMVYDLYLGGKVAGMDLQLGFETFLYEDGYTRKLPTAAIEERVRLDLSYSTDFSETSLQATWTGPRDLSRYRYDEHYNVYNTDVTSAEFGNVSEQKSTKAPAFYLVNAAHRQRLTRILSAVVRINNVFDYTQTGDGDSPTTWHWHKTHAHFDNFHTWGPLQGREYFAGLEAVF